MLDLGQALEALHDGHGCEDEDCYVCHIAEVGAYLVPLLTSDLDATLTPTAAILRRRGIKRGQAKLLRLLEQLEAADRKELRRRLQR